MKQLLIILLICLDKLSLFKEINTFRKEIFLLLHHFLHQFINQIHILTFVGLEEGEIVAGAFALADVREASAIVGFVFFSHGKQGSVWNT